MVYEVSVVIPTYNRLEVLAEVLQALEFQHEAPPFEVIVVDDGSTDGTSHWLRNRTFRLPLRVLTQENRGPAAARNTGQRVRAILQPHRWVRTALHWEALAEAASSADEVLVLDIYAAGEKPIEGISSDLIVERIRSLGTKASYHTPESACDYLLDTAAENDLLLTMGAGDVWRIAAQLSEASQST